MNKLFTKVAALTLGVAMAAGVGVAVGASQKASPVHADNEYELVKNVSSLSASDKVVIASGVSGAVYTMSTTQNNNNRSANGTFTVTNDKITVDSSTQVFTLGKDGDNFTFLTDTGYIYAASSSSNHLRTKTALDDNGKWSVSIAATGAATVVAQGTNTRNILKFNANNGNPIFSAYSSSGTVAIFKATTTPVGTQYDVTDSVENGSVLPSTVSEGATLNATITPDSGYLVPETVSVTMGGTAATHTYQNGVVTVENVTGDVEITGSCVAMPSPEHAGTLEDPYTVEDAYRAIDKGTGLANVYVRGITAGIVTSWSSDHNNISFNISDDGSTDKVLQAYRCISSEAHAIASDSDVPNGATVVMYGTLKKYKTTYELDQGCYIAAYTAPANPIIGLAPNSLEFIEGGEAKQVTVSYQSFGAQPTITVEGTPAYVSCQVDGLTVTVTPTAIGNETVTIKGTNGTEVATADLTVSVTSSHGHVADDPYTVAEALAAPLSAEVYVTGKISAITEVSTSHGNATYNISDDGQDTNSMIIYRGKYINGADFTDASQIEVGGTVVVKGQLTQYQSKNQLAAGNQLVSYVAPAQSAWSDAQKTALETALHGYLPPFFGELAEEMTTTENSAVFTVSGYHSGEFATKLGDGWNLVSDNNYMLVGDNYYLTASIYEYGVRSLPVGDYSEFTFTYHEGQPVNKYSVTYNAGQGTGDDIVISDVEEGSAHALKTFAETEFVAPAGQQFKAWQVGNDAELRDAGYEVTVNGDVTVTAIYEDIPAQKFTITYKSGYGTGDDIVISDVEAGSSHVLKSFDETQFVAPAGQQFKGWRVGSETELRDPGYEITNIQADVNIFANYEDIPVTDWSEEFLNEYTSRFGNADLPPFVDGALAGDENSMYWEEGYPFGYVVAEGDFTKKALTAFVNAWTFVGDVDTGSFIFMDKDMNAFVDIMLDDGYTVLLFTTIGDVTLDTTGVDKDYFVGEAVDTTNLKVHPVLMNGAVVPGLTLPQNPYWSVSPSTFTEAGEQSVTVTVTKFFTTDIELTYSVNVAAVVAESISVSGQATKTSYSAGEEWSAEGLVVTAHYNNGTEADVTDQVTWSFDPAETAVEVTSVSAVAHLGDLSSDAVVFDVVVEQSYDADAFAKDLLEMVAPICANYDGKKNNKVALKTVWDTMSQRYSTLSNEEKAKVIAAAAKTDGTDLEKAMAFYNYACKKYGLAKFIEGRQVKALVAEHETGNSILPIVVIVASSVAAITAIGVVIALKRRKALLAK
ncbi:MAG: bacterial Ig-like domain-containing protein [Bacilli bacterium]|nr:bacterial Ig-like domain-containing protein [Bacilli bacterium]